MDKKKSHRKIPRKPGFYWARTDKEIKNWNAIVLIEGDSPFLHYKSWNYQTNELCDGSNPSNYIFGPKIRDATPPGG